MSQQSSFNRNVEVDSVKGKDYLEPNENVNVNSFRDENINVKNTGTGVDITIKQQPVATSVSDTSYTAFDDTTTQKPGVMDKTKATAQVYADKAKVAGAQVVEKAKEVAHKASDYVSSKVSSNKTTTTESDFIVSDLTPVDNVVYESKSGDAAVLENVTYDETTEQQPGKIARAKGAVVDNTKAIATKVQEMGAAAVQKVKELGPQVAATASAGLAKLQDTAVSAKEAVVGHKATPMETARLNQYPATSTTKTDLESTSIDLKLAAQDVKDAVRMNDNLNGGVIKETDVLIIAAIPEETEVVSESKSVGVKEKVVGAATSVKEAAAPVVETVKEKAAVAATTVKEQAGPALTKAKDVIFGNVEEAKAAIAQPPRDRSNEEIDLSRFEAKPEDQVEADQVEIAAAELKAKATELAGAALAKGKEVGQAALAKGKELGATAVQKVTKKPATTETVVESAPIETYSQPAPAPVENTAVIAEINIEQSLPETYKADIGRSDIADMSTISTRTTVGSPLSGRSGLIDQPAYVDDNKGAVQITLETNKPVAISSSPIPENQSGVLFSNSALENDASFAASAPYLKSSSAPSMQDQFASSSSSSFPASSASSFTNSASQNIFSTPLSSAPTGEPSSYGTFASTAPSSGTLTSQYGLSDKTSEVPYQPLGSAAAYQPLASSSPAQTYSTSSFEQPFSSSSFEQPFSSSSLSSSAAPMYNQTDLVGGFTQQQGPLGTEQSSFAANQGVFGNENSSANINIRISAPESDSNKVPSKSVDPAAPLLETPASPTQGTHTF